MYLVKVSLLVQFNPRQPSVDRNIIHPQFSLLISFQKLFSCQTFGTDFSFLYYIHTISLENISLVSTNCSRDIF